eukprot:UN24610
MKDKGENSVLEQEFPLLLRQNYLRKGCLLSFFPKCKMMLGFKPIFSMEFFILKESISFEFFKTSIVDLSNSFCCVIEMFL